GGFRKSLIRRPGSDLAIADAAQPAAGSSHPDVSGGVGIDAHGMIAGKPVGGGESAEDAVQETLNPLSVRCPPDSPIRRLGNCGNMAGRGQVFEVAVFKPRPAAT